MRVFHFIGLYVCGCTSAAVYFHSLQTQAFSFIQAALAFFLVLNVIVCAWEIALGIHIKYIYEQYKAKAEKYGKSRVAACLDFFNHPLKLSDVLNGKFWGQGVWSTYSLYDPSYSNQESYGFFIDVGNGWSTIIPSLVFLVGMSYQFQHEYLQPKYIGMMGLVKFYQELYGTCIYFLSFFYNKRHKYKGVMEIAGFVGVSNGLWFFLPLLGMYASVQMINTNSLTVFL